MAGIYDWSTLWFASRCAWRSAAMSESRSYLTAAEWPRWTESMTSNHVCTNIITAGANWHPCWQSQWSYWIKQSSRLPSLFDVNWQELAEELFFFFSTSLEETIYCGWVQGSFHCWQGIIVSQLSMYSNIEFVRGAMVKDQEQILLYTHKKCWRTMKAYRTFLWNYLNDWCQRNLCDNGEKLDKGKDFSVYFIEAIFMLYFFCCAHPSQLSKIKKKYFCKTL